MAEVAHDLGILTVGIVTKPFSFEGKRKMGLAEQGIANLLMHVDLSLIHISCRNGHSMPGHGWWPR